ncbi:tyrosine protein phosphatase [Neobacillus piezotolerans]|uniref:Tyrosine-protein phosphatase n=1 Tax=Neobacillus piezotolerans TaxID=2259171 RepID=A0A3D8GNH0_9BACI|nr:CpsB/CapC family capsule biosynthesis tyrosine phosphatase [Neobacillus piezotolerans]RDU35616.1 tyrosine protein phosphatase [Neobacillus piezotolerans]
MIDIHCHILPGVDDGAKTVEESVEMAREAVKEGIHAIIATPHHNRFYENPKEAVIQKAAELNSRLKEENVPLSILPGQEPAISGDFLKDYHKGNILTLNNTHYAFVELPSGHVPRYTSQILYELQNFGVIPIIVHPERNQGIIERPAILNELIRNGALAQLTASSLCGVFGKNIKNFSRQLIEANLVHFIASDAHNTNRRTFHMLRAFEEIETRYGPDFALFFRENAERLIEGKNVHKDEPQKVKRKKLLGIF